MRRFALRSAVLLTLWGAATVQAQTATGTITGTVRDSTGAVVPRAKVTLASQDTGLNRDTATSESGDYSFTTLPVGSYSVTAEQQGFQTAKEANIRLNVNQV